VCGICGIVGLNDKDLAKSVISRMNAALAHRGPDDEGSLIDTGIALGHRRLSIIDLSKNGHQPMFSANGRFAIIYNGELYNYKNLKFELLRAKIGDKNSIAYPFSTQSDTEVILAAYQRWGVDCLKYFNGMFALAIWDKEREEIFIARDRLGIKPLYYLQNKGIVFASEIRALLKSNLVPRKLNKNAIEDYVTFQTVHAPATIVEDVKMLLPGHYLLIKRSDVNVPVKQQKYWGLNDAVIQNEEKSYDDICKDVRDLFFSAVERRLLSDVPFGAFLSGGIDSSLVVAVMSGLMREKVNTFTVAFDESKYSEASYAEQMAKQYNTVHHEIKLSLKLFLEKLPEAVNAMDHPSGDGMNSYIVSEVTKKAGITMALSGLGGDELFAGYPLFKRLFKLNKFKWVKGFPFALLPAHLYKLKQKSIAANKLLELFKLPDWNLENTYPLMRRTMFDGEADNLLNSLGKLNREIIQNPGYGILSKISVAELSSYLPDILLRDTDQMSMAHALEVRVPFLDHTLVEYVLGLPDEVKYPHTPKKLLTDAMKGLIPGNIINREKMGFTFPWDTWMRNDLMAFCEKNMDSLSKRKYFNKNNTRALWKGFLDKNPLCPYYKIWHLVVLENWIKENSVDA
jgi:asparagine synthase (glutamine-hydrolysing)